MEHLPRSSTCQPVKHQYRPEIDGLRAIAVLAVVFYHAGELIPGGYVGVDVFFVISGFLITKVIQSQIDDGSFSIIEFWERRIRRLMPALAIMVAVTLGLGCLFLTPPALRDLGYSSTAQVALVANVYFWRHTGYFAEAAETKPLLHTWSLAVEEQFYLALPALLLVLAFLRRRSTPAVLTALLLLSFALSHWATKTHAAANFFLLPTRAWELLAGSLLTYLPRTTNVDTRWKSVTQWAGMLLLLGPMLVFDRLTPFPGLGALAPVTGTVLVIWASAGNETSLLSRGLSSRLLTFIGLISYSLYLWHWPILVYLETGWPHHGSGALAIAVALSLLAGALSWRLVETPVRRRKLFRSRATLFGAAAGATSLLAAASALLAITDGLPGRLDPGLNDRILDTQYRGLEYANALNATETTFVPLGVDPADGTPERPDFLLWGDSHAMVFAGAIDQIAAEEGLTGFALVKSSHLPIPDAWMPFLGNAESQQRDRDEVLAFLRQRRPKRLLIAARWTCYLEGPSELELEDQPEDANWYAKMGTRAKSKATSREAIAEGLLKLIGICESTSTELVLIRQVPESGIPSPSQEAVHLAMQRITALPETPNTYASFEVRRRSFDAILSGLEENSVRIIDPAPSFKRTDGGLLIFVDGISAYRDADHLSWSGLQRVDTELRTALGALDSTSD